MSFFLLYVFLVLSYLILKTHTTKKTTQKTEIDAKRIQWKYSRKETNNKNNDVPKSTEDKVYSAVVSPITKVLPDNGPYVAEICCN
jgi:hypothetical protein